MEITFTQQTPGSWSRMHISVDGEVRYQAVKAVGPGFWSIYDLNGEPLHEGYGSNKKELKAAVLNYLATQ